MTRRFRSIPFSPAASGLRPIAGFLLSILALSLFPGPARAFTPPSPDMPESVYLFGRTIDLSQLKSPLEPGNKNQDIKEGGALYAKNCVFCHGDLLDGKGVFGKSYFPPPADLTHPKSLLSKPPAYAFWRIAKGGPGLPESFGPWNSAMPAWEGQLNEEEIWKVILFIRQAAADMNRVPGAQDAAATPSLDRGRAVYQEKCIHCHGETGKGDGPAAALTSPKPRNFIKGQYKIRSTPFGKIPTDDDLMAMLERNYPGTTMPSWAHLPKADRESLVLYLKSLSKKFQKFIDRKKEHKVIVAPEPPELSLEALAAGKSLFIQNCSGCHGVKGRSDGDSTKKVVDLASDAIWPRNLSEPWLFRRGDSLKDLYLTLRTGLSTTAMPRFSERTFKDEQIWALAHYVRTLALSEKPPLRKTLAVKKVDGTLPETPGDPRWEEADSYVFPLGGQLMAGDKSYHPTVRSITAKALHNGDEIALYLHWDDPRVDPILALSAEVHVSPPPPLPPHLRMALGENEEPETPPAPEAQEFPDAVAAQFPVAASGSGPLPYFLNGDNAHPVNLWRWSTHPMAAEEYNARGLTQWQKQPEESQSLSSRAAYGYGRYFLVMKRKLKTPNQDDAQFQEGAATPVAFNVWDGSVGEKEAVKAVSSWFEMRLE
ncbi:MAG: c-type cytochrome [Nitrospinaceae bacterium]|nr:MAG: c-type cytochrome [Nitrospinaceae bacterium]